MNPAWADEEEEDDEDFEDEEQEPEYFDVGDLEHIPGQTAKALKLLHSRQTHEPELYYAAHLRHNLGSFFVMDVRTHRTNFTQDPSLWPFAQRSMLGTRQLHRIYRFLMEAPREKWKVLVSPVLWADQGADSWIYKQQFSADGEPMPAVEWYYLDGWWAYEHERNNLLDFIQAKGIRNVVLLSGDSHWSGIFWFWRQRVFEVWGGDSHWSGIFWFWRQRVFEVWGGGVDVCRMRVWGGLLSFTGGRMQSSCPTRPGGNSRSADGSQRIGFSSAKCQPVIVANFCA